jgi:SAM-dependent methyltransferase
MTVGNFLPWNIRLPAALLAAATRRAVLYDLGTEIRRWSEFLAIKLKGYQPERHTPEDWSRQYQDGAWAYLADLSERARYSVIAGYMAEIEPDRILDVGCGEGLLARGIQHLSFRSYVGIDFSPAAVAAARARLGEDKRLDFAVADAETYRPEAEFDAIIFSECLNYLSDPLGVVQHYCKSIAANGSLIVSLFQSPRADKAWSMLEAIATVRDSVNISHHSGKRWKIKLLTPRERW